MTTAFFALKVGPTPDMREVFAVAPSLDDAVVHATNDAFGLCVVIEERDVTDASLAVARWDDAPVHVWNVAGGAAVETVVGAPFVPVS